MIGLPFSNISNDERFGCCLAAQLAEGVPMSSLWGGDVPKAVYAKAIPVALLS